jgi:type II secretory pathway pseudopilin PulG
LGILAAVVIFALSGVTGQSKASACNAYAKSVVTAVEAYRNSPDNTTNAWPASFDDLTAPNTNGLAGTGAQPFLRTAPANNNGYKVTLGANGVVKVSTNGNAATDYDTTNLCNGLAG